MTLPEYLAKNYGRCNAAHCRCRCTRPNCKCGGGVWLGTNCKDWTPTAAQNFDELRQWQGVSL